MARNSYTTSHKRSGNAISGVAVEYIGDDPKTGKRWAYSRAFKRSIGNHRYDSVVAWVCRERNNGKVRTVQSGVDEATARAFVSEG